MNHIKQTTLLLSLLLLLTACNAEEKESIESNVSKAKEASIDIQTNQIPQYLSYKNAITMAQQSQKTVLIKLTAEHCRYCKKMDKEVLTDNEVLTSLKKDFITVEIDVDKNEIPLNINRSMTPTFVFVSKDEQIISKIPGSWGKKDFLDILNFVLKKTKGVQS